MFDLAELLLPEMSFL